MISELGFQIILWAMVVFAGLSLIESIIIFLTRRTTFFELSFVFAKYRGFGKQFIIHNSRDFEVKKVYLGKDHANVKNKDEEHDYMVESNSIVSERKTGIKSIFHRYDIPTPINFFDEKVNTYIPLKRVTAEYKVPVELKDFLIVMPQYVYDDKGNQLNDGDTGKPKITDYILMVNADIPRANWFRKDSSQKVAQYLVKMKFLALADWIKKNWMIVLGALGLIGLITVYGIYSSHNDIGTMTKTCQAQWDFCKNALTQAALAGLPK